ncbi:MAG: PDZ domain-containing protein [Opitutaceae bacterium]|nr:PDZ domain-containing protein [Opitutaceae bacterium]
MKTSRRCLSSVLCLAAIGPLSFAADNEVRKDFRVIVHKGDDGPKESVTFLGVETAPVSRTLTEQLGLAPDTGLVVISVAPHSPAAVVLKPHDILVKLEDQKLIETRQLAVLVRGHKEGDEVTITYLRGGKEATAKIKLAKHDVPRMDGLHRQHFGPGEDGLRRLGEMPAMPREEMDRLLPLIDLGREWHTRIIRPGPDGGEGPEVTAINTANSNMVLTDDAGTLEVKLTDGKKEVVAKNAKGEVIFSGPYNTAEERKAAPAEIRGRLDKLEHMEGFRFKADADFHPGNFDVLVPSGHQLQFTPAPGPVPVRKALPPAPPML